MDVKNHACMNENDGKCSLKLYSAHAYDLRSGIVHGKDVRPIKIEGKTFQPSDFASKVEEYVRKSIRLFIALSRTYKKQETIIKELDKSLLNVNLRKKLHRLTKFA